MPFDPTVKRTEGTIRDSTTGRTFKCTKGAPNVLAKLIEIDRDEVQKRVDWKVSRETRAICASVVCRPAKRAARREETPRAAVFLRRSPTSAKPRLKTPLSNSSAPTLTTTSTNPKPTTQKK